MSALNAGQCSEMIVTQLQFCIIRESSSKKLVILYGEGMLLTAIMLFGFLVI